MRDVKKMRELAALYGTKVRLYADGEESTLGALVYFCEEFLKAAKSVETTIVPWELVNPEYKWAVTDKNGKVFVVKDKPYLDVDEWMCDPKSPALPISHIVGTVAATCLTQDSLVQRPE